VGPLTLSTLQAISQKMASGSQVLRMWQLNGGMSADMTAFECRLPNRLLQRFVIRQTSDQDAQYEYELLQYLAKSGLPVAKPYLLDTSKTVLPQAFLVLDYLPGTTSFSRSWGATFIEQAANALALLHQFSLAQAVPDFVPVTPYDIAAYTGVVTASPDWDIDVRAVLAQLHEVWPLEKSHRDVLLHGDFWPGNLLWQKNVLSGIIDWEDAQFGDPLFDLAVARLDIRCFFSEEMMQQFTDFYASYTELDLSLLPWWDLIAVVRLARLIGNDLAGWSSFFESCNRLDLNMHTLRIHLHTAIDQAFQQIEYFAREV
jgi:aminoglycoside phosphotransferase (APT) family kinase protein